MDKPTPNDIIRAANKHVIKRYDTSDNPRYFNDNACMKDFISGANWERERDKWISVKDHLPESGQMVLICSGENLFLNLNFFIFRRVGDNAPAFEYYRNGGLLFIEKDSITHWMPVPIPPKK